MELTKIVETLKTCNAKVYLVGGAVRDLLLDIVPKDKDYCVTGISQEGFESLFPTAMLQGKDFPVYRMDIDGELCEVALARKERKVSEGHNGFAIYASPDITIEDDLARRDITINSMAIDEETKELIDPYYGEIDLRNKLIRATTEAFCEDPLRVYRAARFAAEYGFFIEYKTSTMMYQLKSELSSLSIERVLEETKKALMSRTPSRFFHALKSANVLDVHFPEIDRLSELEQNLMYHPEGDVFEHTMQVVDSARYLVDELPVGNKLVVMFSSLLHDVGKYVTKGVHRIKGTPTYFGHEEAGVPIAEQFLDRFNLKSYKKAILFNVAGHMVFHDKITDMKNGKAVDFMEGKFEYSGSDYIRKPGLLPSVGCVHDYIAVCMADTIGRIQDPEKLPYLLQVVSYMMRVFHTRDTLYTDKVIRRLLFITGSYETTSNLAISLTTAIQHKCILEIYVEESKNITCLLDIEDLKKMYKGEKLGYMIHKDKRAQRTVIMKNARKEMSEYVEKMV
ncbi:HD domain-containing protein [Bacillus cereus]|uniref:HD domain-containing protein n=1 Tax=Bacillus cereus TaxID=1396 RepID=UPI000BF608E8|nr:HD domain-containing protein [Bacillus cereus]PFB64499.1 tRNA nucleotidyltransferase [Bacillus cereus]PGT10127.1 tRNA nucleotidyltransferase [Bacillus cereus]